MSVKLQECCARGTWEWNAAGGQDSEARSRRAPERVVVVASGYVNGGICMCMTDERRQRKRGAAQRHSAP